MPVPFSSYPYSPKCLEFLSLCPSASARDGPPLTEGFERMVANPVSTTSLAHEKRYHCGARPTRVVRLSGQGEGVFPPETQYARSGDVFIAYQVLGDAPLDLVYVPGFVSHLDHYWEAPPIGRFFQRLASFSRLILLDKRETGLSDRVAGIATLEDRMDDVRAVMDTVGSEQAAVFGISEGGPMSMLFAATYPNRTSALIVYGAFPKFSYWIPTPEALEHLLTKI